MSGLCENKVLAKCDKFIEAGQIELYNLGKPFVRIINRLNLDWEY